MLPERKLYFFLLWTERSVLSAISRVQYKNRKRAMDTLLKFGLSDKIDQLAMISSFQ